MCLVRLKESVIDAVPTLWSALDPLFFSFVLPFDDESSEESSVKIRRLARRRK